MRTGGGRWGFVLLLPTLASAAGVTLGSRAELTPPGRGHAIPVFSVLAVGTVGLLTVSGLYLAELHLGSLEQLLSTPYGRTLLAKLAVVVLMLGLGGYHQFIAHPRRVGNGVPTWWSRQAYRQATTVAARGRSSVARLVYHRSTTCGRAWSP